MPDNDARNVLVTGGSRGLGLAIARKLAAAGYRVIAVARQQEQRDHRGDRAIEAGRGRARFISCRSTSARSTRSRIWCGGCARNSARSSGSSTTPRSAPTARWRLMHNAKIEQLVRVNTLSPHRADQICGARDDGGRRRPHRQCRLDHRLHRLQRAFGLCGDQSVDGRLYPLAGARGRAARHHRQCGRAGLSRRPT